MDASADGSARRTRRCRPRRRRGAVGGEPEGDHGPGVVRVAATAGPAHRDGARGVLLAGAHRRRPSTRPGDGTRHRPGGRHGHAGALAVWVVGLRAGRPRRARGRHGVARRLRRRLDRLRKRRHGPGDPDGVQGLARRESVRARGPADRQPRPRFQRDRAARAGADAGCRLGRPGGGRRRRLDRPGGRGRRHARVGTGRHGRRTRCADLHHGGPDARRLAPRRGSPHRRVRVRRRGRRPPTPGPGPTGR